MYEVRDSTPADLLWLAEHMRDSDREEIMATCGATPAQSMLVGKGSSYMKTAVVDKTPALVFGVCPSPQDNAGVVWMLATDQMLEKRTRFLLARYSRQWVEDMNALYPLLFNMTDARNTAHHRWLGFCGFRFIRQINHGPLGAPFYEFAKVKSNV